MIDDILFSAAEWLGSERVSTQLQTHSPPLAVFKAMVQRSLCVRDVTCLPQQRADGRLGERAILWLLRYQK